MRRKIRIMTLKEETIPDIAKMTGRTEEELRKQMLEALKQNEVVLVRIEYPW